MKMNPTLIAFGALALSVSALAATPEKVSASISKSVEITSVMKAIKKARNLSCLPLALENVQVSPQAGDQFGTFSAVFHCNDKNQGANATEITLSGYVVEAADGGPVYAVPTNYAVEQAE